MINNNSSTYSFFCDTINDVRGIVKSMVISSNTRGMHVSIDLLPSGRYEVICSLTYHVRDSDKD